MFQKLIQMYIFWIIQEILKLCLTEKLYVHLYENGWLLVIVKVEINWIYIHCCQVPWMAWSADQKRWTFCSDVPNIWKFIPRQTSQETTLESKISSKESDLRLCLSLHEIKWNQKEETNYIQSTEHSTRCHAESNVIGGGRWWRWWW